MMQNDRNHVQVLTAGGAGRPARTTPVFLASDATPLPRTALGNSTTPSHPISPFIESSSTQPQPLQHQHRENEDEESDLMTLEYEQEEELQPLSSSQPRTRRPDGQSAEGGHATTASGNKRRSPYKDNNSAPAELDPHHSLEAAASSTPSKGHELLWLLICFIGIMASFVGYGLLLEYTTSGGRHLHEMSFLFVTSAVYTLTAAAGRYVRDEKPTTIPPARFAVLGILSMGSTFCSVRSLRYVIFPIQVLAKSCKPVPVMLMGAIMGKRYPMRKYINVFLIVMGVALFMGGGDKKKKASDADDTMSSSAAQVIGLLLLFISLCFDGATGAYEDKLMSVHSVQPFDLMYNIQLGKTILAFIGLLVLNQMHLFILMVQEMGFLLVALGLSGAIGQIFIFITIAKFGALTCSIIGLARKVTTLVASIYFYGHHLTSVQSVGLIISVASMVYEFMGKKKGGGGGHGGGGEGGGEGGAGHSKKETNAPEEMEKMLSSESTDDEEEGTNLELVPPAAAKPPSS